MPSRFRVKFEVIDPGQGVWKTARVHVFEDDGAGAHQIGRYDRNHAGSCRDLGGEERHTNGFCPVDYYVPYDHPDVDKAGDAGRFGFVAGCIWGDDSSWKMQCLDLSEVSKGMLVRKESFGYLPMPHNVAGVIECQARTAVRATLGSTVRPPLADGGQAPLRVAKSR